MGDFIQHRLTNMLQIRTRPPTQTARCSKNGARFVPTVFFATAAKGRAISRHSPKAIIFAQGNVADAVFYIRSGKVEVTVVSKQDKEAVVDACWVNPAKSILVLGVLTSISSLADRSSFTTSRSPHTAHETWCERRRDR